jgi:beta-glucuronidase
VELENTLVKAADVTIFMSVKDGAGAAVYRVERQIHISQHHACLDVSAVVAGVSPWSPDAPVLYTLEVQCVWNDTVTDERIVRFGFRAIETTSTDILLNGDRIFLTGFNRHGDSPSTGLALDTDRTRADLVAMKNAGANAIRLCHYPHDPSELDMCDEIGLLAFCEIPLYFWNDEHEGEQYQSQRAEAAERQLINMIRRDINHPSVIFWSVSNETNEDHPEVAQDNRRLIEKARTIDPSRLCVHVSNHWKDSPNFEADDVICINGYPSMAWVDLGRRGWPDQADAGERWQTDLHTLRSRFPDKPILVTEFGYVSFAGTNGHRFGEDTHSRVLEIEYSGLTAPYLCGALVWCWADHPWPPGRFLGGLSSSPFGVVSRGRTPKSALETARHLFQKRNPPGLSPPSG